MRGNRISTCHLFFTGLLASLLTAGSLGAGVDRPAFEWEMAERYGLDLNGNGIVDPHDDLEDIHPSSWAVSFDACHWLGDFVEFELLVDGVPVATSGDCRISIDFSELGRYLVTLRARTGADAVVEDLRSIFLRDILVVGLGDSYGSGEGAPDIGLGGAELDEAVAAFDHVREGAATVAALALEVERLESSLADISGEVSDALGDLEEARDDVASKLSALDRARSDLASIEADARPVREAAAQWKHDCVDDFGFFRCPAATGALVAQLVSYGISAGTELIEDGYNAIVAAIDAGITAARRARDAAQRAYDAAVAIRDDAQNAYNALIASQREIQNALSSARNALSAAQSGLQPVIESLVASGGVASSQWQDVVESAAPFDCHRSARSAQALAALALEQADPHSTVTFIHRACSGAVTGDLSDTQILNLPLDDGSRLFDFSLADLVGDREIDAVFLSIGGNNANFSDIIKSLIAHADVDNPDLDPGALAPILPLCDLVPQLAPVCSQVQDLPEATAVEQLRDGLANIASEYADMAGVLAELIDPARVFITEYGDAARDDRGDYCGPTAAPGISAGEWEWVAEVVVPSINAAVSDAATAHGWNLVRGIQDLYGRHGYCAEDNWMVTFEESAVIQGDMSGTAHPNSTGYAEVANVLASDVGTMLEASAGTRFRRGDANVDGGVDVSDVILTLGYQFLGNFEPACLDALDFNDDDTIDVSDPIASLGFQFLGLAPAAPPGTETCGLDPTEDGLTCESYPGGCEES